MTLQLHGAQYQSEMDIVQGYKLRQSKLLAISAFDRRWPSPKAF
jgi:hypothetical protein